MTERPILRVLCAGWLVAGVMLAIALGSDRHPYAFYAQLRWICCVVFIYSAFAFTYSAVDAYRSRRKDPDVAVPIAFNSLIAVVFATGALFFNPIIPFHFRQETWRLLDLLAFGLMAIFALALWSSLELTPVFTRRTKLLVWLIVAGFVAYNTAEYVIHLYGKYVLATISTTATVVAMREEAVESDTGQSGVISTGRYKFKVNGKAYYGRTHRYDMGDKLVVRFNPANPKDNRASTESFRSDFETLVVIAIVIALLWQWLKSILASHKKQADNSQLQTTFPSR